ncbi:MAG TPA: MFS transporter [Rugosimonospora sp.]|nr:MFS transporter [Rugosimonospora sp.]
MVSDAAPERAPVIVSHRRRRLLWHRDFGLLWTGETVSKVGSGATDVALPLVAVTTMHAGTFAIGVLGAATWLPYLLVSLPAGAWVDRFDRRPVMVASNVTSAVLFLTVPVAAWLGVLHIGQLVVVAFCAGFAKVFFRTAFQAYLRTVVPRERLAEGTAMLQGSAAGAEVAGPGIAGLMAQAFGAVSALLADAVSFLFSTVCLLAIRSAEAPNADPRRNAGLFQRIADGLRYTARDPYLRTLTLYGSVGNLTVVSVQTLLVVFLIRVVGVGSATTGLLMAGMGAGGVAGALLAGPLIRRLGSARTLLVCAAGATPFGLLVPLTDRGPRLLLFPLGLGVLGAGIVVGNVVGSSFRQAYCPPHLIGRVSAIVSLMVFGALPVGALIGGAIGAALGLRTALWVLCTALLLPTLVVVFSPISRLRELPRGAP